MLQAYQNISHSNKKIEKILKSFFLLHPKNIDLSLDRIKRLLRKLDNPHRKIKNIIHIAGTNGKGSIATILYYLQKSQGKTINIYRSPHLINFNERIYIRNKQISNKYLLEILEHIKYINKSSPITFFEIITAAAFYIYHKNQADLTILEVGLGGRFDATNVIDKNLVSIISTIDIDHKEFLGNTINSIAKEKVEIIKKNSCVISSKQKADVNRIIREKVKDTHSSFHGFNESWKIKGKIFYHEEFTFNLANLSLFGRHQYLNASCALMACIKKKELNIDYNNLEKILPTIYWPGRIERVKKKIPFLYRNLEIWVDVAHNKLGFEVLLEWIKKMNMDNYYIILALGIKKDYINILKEIEKFKPRELCLISSTNFQRHSPTKIKSAALKLGMSPLIFKSVFEALDYIKEFKEGQKQVIITGSIGLVGSFMSQIK